VRRHDESDGGAATEEDATTAAYTAKGVAAVAGGLPRNEAPESPAEAQRPWSERPTRERRRDSCGVWFFLPGEAGKPTPHEHEA
jgi:hypothetical protein